jgi:DNA-directed RNA polymerase specialized sigma24 family protein
MRPWFFAMVANECRSARRSRWWSVVRAVVPEPIFAPQDDAIVAGVELRQALRAIDMDKRLALVLH